MKNEFYALIILDSAGRTVHRRRIARRTVRHAIAVSAGVMLALVVCTVHGLVAWPTAKASHAIRSENAEMRELTQRLESELPKLRRISLGANVEFDQIWAKSGLGVEARGLAVGPFESPEGSPVSLADNASIISTMDPIELPIEVERILGDGHNAQRQLGELLEYFHDAERMLSNTPSLRPAHSPWITSGFGRREDPVHGGLAVHKGLDIGGSIGTEVFAPADGVVIFVGKRGGYGNVVVVDHGYGLQTHYAHLSRFRSHVGDHLRRGDTLGEMGSTGKSTGPHLHYEVRRYGRPLDPAHFILD